MPPSRPLLAITGTKPSPATYTSWRSSATARCGRGATTGLAAGDGSTNNTGVPVQVGSATNWIKAGPGSSKALPCSPMAASGIGATTPTRTSTCTSARSRSPRAFQRTPTGWTWASGRGRSLPSGRMEVWNGRNAHVYTGVSDQSLDATPTVVGAPTVIGRASPLAACGGGRA